MESFDTRTTFIHGPKKGKKTEKSKKSELTKKVKPSSLPKKQPRKRKPKESSCEEEIIDGFVISSFKSLAEMMVSSSFLLLPMPSQKSTNI